MTTITELDARFEQLFAAAVNDKIISSGAREFLNARPAAKKQLKDAFIAGALAANGNNLVTPKVTSCPTAAAATAKARSRTT